MALQFEHNRNALKSVSGRCPRRIMRRDLLTRPEARPHPYSAYRLAISFLMKSSRSCPSGLQMRGTSTKGQAHVAPFSEFCTYLVAD
jgi:hypothetical protein